ncbi:MAG TPA: UbiA family prenyltransferase, partial [Mucilaginibacter sp.]|nr:UbiA family prenyltransferase [Mucilaginibacter sp.]
MEKIFVYLRMMRPANVVTSVADVLAGAAIAGVFSAEIFKDHLQAVIMLCFSTACLYGGGIVFNDVFDADLDKIERPERAIPSGRVSQQQASVFGSILLLAGIISAGLVSAVSASLAVAISL